MYRRHRGLYRPSRELNRLQDDMNRLFEAYTPSRIRRAPGFPSLNIWNNEDGLVITAEVAGISPDDIDILSVTTL